MKKWVTSEVDQTLITNQAAPCSLFHTDAVAALLAVWSEVMQRLPAGSQALWPLWRNQDPAASACCRAGLLCCPATASRWHVAGGARCDSLSSGAVAEGF